MNLVIKSVAAIAAYILATPSFAREGAFYGLLRARDVTPFGSLRLDMRPGHAVAIDKGTFALELEVAYQNTWALSPEVEKYLIEREPLGRHELGPDDVQAIRDLPGENYLLDVETATIDLTTHYKFSDAMSAYLIVSAITYHGGFLDSTIEGFHDSFGFSTFGRPAVRRDDVNMIFDLKSSQTTFLEAATSGGLADPTLGVRYTGLRLSDRWMLGLRRRRQSSGSRAPDIAIDGPNRLWGPGHAAAARRPECNLCERGGSLLRWRDRSRTSGIADRADVDSRI